MDLLRICIPPLAALGALILIHGCGGTAALEASQSSGAEGRPYRLTCGSAAYTYSCHPNYKSCEAARRKAEERHGRRSFVCLAAIGDCRPDDPAMCR